MIGQLDPRRKEFFFNDPLTACKDASSCQPLTLAADFSRPICTSQRSIEHTYEPDRLSRLGGHGS